MLRELAHRVPRLACLVTSCLLLLAPSLSSHAQAEVLDIVWRYLDQEYVIVQLKNGQVLKGKLQRQSATHFILKMESGDNRLQKKATASSVKLWKGKPKPAPSQAKVTFAHKAKPPPKPKRAREKTSTKQAVQNALKAFQERQFQRRYMRAKSYKKRRIIAGWSMLGVSYVTQLIAALAICSSNDCSGFEAYSFIPFIGGLFPLFAVRGYSSPAVPIFLLSLNSVSGATQLAGLITAIVGHASSLPKRDQAPLVMNKGKVGPTNAALSPTQSFQFAVGPH